MYSEVLSIVYWLWVVLQGGLSTSTMVKVVVEDVNDNFPEFLTR
jgi:hypothetical protein